MELHFVPFHLGLRISVIGPAFYMSLAEILNEENDNDI